MEMKVVSVLQSILLIIASFFIQIQTGYWHTSSSHILHLAFVFFRMSAPNVATIIIVIQGEPEIFFINGEQGQIYIFWEAI